MDRYETVRAKRQPDTVLCVFVGESRPDSGKFFYNGDSILYFAMRDALKDHLSVRSSDPEAFLDAFQAAGYFLDDLVSSPINKLAHSLRIDARKCGIAGLASRLRSYSPRFVVSVGKSWAAEVTEAIRRSSIDTQMDMVAFPREAGKSAFVDDMRRRIVPALAKLSAA